MTGGLMSTGMREAAMAFATTKASAQGLVGDVSADLEGVELAPKRRRWRKLRARGRRILVWSPDGDGGTPGRPSVERPVIATGARKMKPRTPGGRPALVESERGHTYRPGQYAPAYLADLPSTPRLRCPSRGPNRAMLRAEAESPVVRRRMKGGRAARTALAAYALHGHTLVLLPDMSRGGRMVLTEAPR